ncbi:MAG: HAMP domain-containing histidine kinase [Moraxellaceae bacterium]|nr:MAG: HAMP domain-containing histidine kinase [Moraxellaceae bacterium]
MSEGKSRQNAASEPFGGDTAAFLMAAHELKSPLALVRQLALALEANQVDSGQQDRIVQQILLTAERALRLTTDLTTSSRQDTLFHLEPLNPVSLCEEVAHELTPLFAAQGKRIEVVNRIKPPLVVANRDLLRRILLNFGDNALHYSSADHPVSLAVQTTGEKVRVGVRDYGPAVTADIWQVLQKRLRAQTTQPVSGRPQSSGLGLYIADQFARMMSGEIGAMRHRDGATFYVDMAASRQLSLL